MSVRTYNPSVRVGNWNEDIQLEEDTLKDFLSRRERGELLTQKQAKLKDTMLKQSKCSTQWRELGGDVSQGRGGEQGGVGSHGHTDLSIARCGVVNFGDKVMVVNTGSQDGSRKPAALSINATESTGNAGTCGIVGSTNVQPCLRTAFVIKSMDGTPDGQPLRYGQSFYLCTAEGGLWLFSDRATFQKSARKSRNNEVSLATSPSHLTEWKIVSFDPMFRLELEHSSVKANEKIIFTHVKTNQNLCVEKDHLLRSPFGQEFEVTSYTDLDSHKAEKDTNHWMLMMNVPGDSIMPVDPPSN